jgi:hypothetical protein
MRQDKPLHAVKRNLRLQTRPIQLSHWPTVSKQRPKIPDRISERPQLGGLSDSAMHYKFVRIHQTLKISPARTHSRYW